MIKIRYSGDRIKAASLLTEAKRRLSILLQQMELGKLDRLSARSLFPDGSRISVASVFGVSLIDIYCPPVDVEGEEERRELPFLIFLYPCHQTVITGEGRLDTESAILLQEFILRKKSGIWSFYPYFRPIPIEVESGFGLNAVIVSDRTEKRHAANYRGYQKRSSTACYNWGAWDMMDFPEDPAYYGSIWTYLPPEPDPNLSWEKTPPDTLHEFPFIVYSPYTWIDNGIQALGAHNFEVSRFRARYDYAFEGWGNVDNCYPKWVLTHTIGNTPGIFDRVVDCMYDGDSIHYEVLRPIAALGGNDVAYWYGEYDGDKESYYRQVEYRGHIWAENHRKWEPWLENFCTHDWTLDVDQKTTVRQYTNGIESGKKPTYYTKIFFCGEAIASEQQVVEWDTVAQSIMYVTNCIWATISGFAGTIFEFRELLTVGPEGPCGDVLPDCSCYYQFNQGPSDPGCTVIMSPCGVDRAYGDECEEGCEWIGCCYCWQDDPDYTFNDNTNGIVNVEMWNGYLAVETTTKKTTGGVITTVHPYDNWRDGDNCDSLVLLYTVDTVTDGWEKWVYANLPSGPLQIYGKVLVRHEYRNYIRRDTILYTKTKNGGIKTETIASSNWGNQYVNDLNYTKYIADGTVEYIPSGVSETKLNGEVLVLPTAHASALGVMASFGLQKYSNGDATGWKRGMAYMNNSWNKMPQGEKVINYWNCPESAPVVSGKTSPLPGNMKGDTMSYQVFDRNPCGISAGGTVSVRSDVGGSIELTITSNPGTTQRVVYRLSPDGKYRFIGMTVTDKFIDRLSVNGGVEAPDHSKHFEPAISLHSQQPIESYQRR
jgi:hypothetical protein